MIQTTSAPAGKWLYHQTFAYGDQVRYGCDGTSAWIQDTRDVLPMTPRQRLDLQLWLDVQAPMKIRELYPRMDLTGAGTVSGRDAHRILATSKDGIDTELAFVKETGMLLRAGELVFEDYREVDGVKRPFRLLLGKTDEEEHLQMKMEIALIEHGVDVDAMMFQKPAWALPLAEAPLYKRRKEVQVSPDALDVCVGAYQHPDLPEVTYAVSRQQDHLMIRKTGWPSKFEIIPESETDYFMRFLRMEFHFAKDESGKITHLEIRADKTIKAERITK